MYTEVTFGLFLERLFTQAKADRGIEFGKYPNIAISWRDGDCLYEIINGFSVRIFRWPPHEKREETIAGPDWDNLLEPREEFEARFQKDFLQVLDRLSS